MHRLSHLYLGKWIQSNWIKHCHIIKWNQFSTEIFYSFKANNGYEKCLTTMKNCHLYIFAKVKAPKNICHLFHGSEGRTCFLVKLPGGQVILQTTFKRILNLHPFNIFFYINRGVEKAYPNAHRHIEHNCNKRGVSYTIYRVFLSTPFFRSSISFLCNSRR